MQVFLPVIKLYKSDHAVAVGAIFLILLLSIVVFFDTWDSMVSIWIRSETFTHGFFVIPASLWLIWQNKAIQPYLFPRQPSYFGLGFILINGFIWLLASITHTLVIQQYALVSILIGSFWFYLGNSVIKYLVFPLLFLYFMVPVGEALLPFLMEYTATFTIELLRFTGLSVYREGMHFSLVSGEWSVIEACGGLRYLLASITLGVIYAYITYTKTYKRVVFIIFSIILPIIANGFRAYMIVMIGHLSDMKLAVGIDHLIYGAIFFGVIIFIMFYIGSFWRDPLAVVTISSEIDTAKKTYTIKQNGFITATLIISLGLWSLISIQLQSRYHAQTKIPEWPTLMQAEWGKVEAPDWGWQPKIEDAVTESLKYFENQDATVGFYQVNFGDEEQGAELINTKNRLIHRKYWKQWHSIKQSTVQLDNPSITADLVTIRNNRLNRDITTLGWYQIGSNTTNNIYFAKLYQIFKRLTLDTTPETFNVLFFNVSKNTDINIENLLIQKKMLSQ